MRKSDYTLTTHKGTNFLLSRVVTNLLRVIIGHGSPCTYDYLIRTTKIHQRSMYVYMQRLVEAELVTKVKKMEGSPKRERVYIKAARGIKAGQPMCLLRKEKLEWN